MVFKLSYIRTLASKTRYLALLLFLLSFINSAFHSYVPYISLWDEMYHLSYVQYITEFKLPVPNIPMSEWSRTYFSCMPIYPNGFVTSATCGQISPLELFPEGGRNSAAHWAPTYYVVLALFMKPFLLLGFDPLRLARLATALIWGLGISALFVSLYRISKNRIGAFSVALVVTSLPAAFYHSSFVTPYSMIPALLACQIFLVSWFVASINQKSLAVNTFFLIANIAIVVSLPQMIFSFLILVIAFALEVSYTSRRSIWLVWLVPFATAGISAKAYSHWVSFQQSRALVLPALPPGTFTQLTDNTFTVRESLRFFRWYAWPRSIYDWPFLARKEFQIGYLWAFIVTCLIVAFLLAAQMELRKFLAFSILLVAPFVGFYFDQELPFGPPMRYVWPVGVLSICVLGFIDTKSRINKYFLIFSLLTYLASFGMTAFGNLGI